MGALGALAPEPALSQDASASADGLRKRASRLESRAREWLGARKRLVDTCPSCEGRGWRIGTFRRFPCGTCDQRGRYVPPKIYRRLFYDMASPAFRIREDSRKIVEDGYRAANSGNPWPDRLVRFQLRGPEVIDAIHGVVEVRWNRDSTWRPMRWIWAKDQDDRWDWFVYDEQSDGAWPDLDAEVFRTKVCEVAPEEPASAARLGNLLRAVAPDFALDAATREGRRLILTLRPPQNRVSAEQLCAAEEAISRKILATDADVESLRLHWLDSHKNVLGQERPMPRWRSDRSRVKPGVDAEGSAPAVEWHCLRHADWVIWPSEDGASLPREVAGSPHIEIGPLGAKDAKVVSSLLASLATGFRVLELFLEGDTLILRLLPLEGTLPEEHVMQDVVPITRAILSSSGPWRGVRIEWTALWRDADGQTEAKTTWTSGLAPGRFNGIAWDNLAILEQLRVFEWEQYRYQGWILWPRRGAGEEKASGAD